MEGCSPQSRNHRDGGLGLIERIDARCREMQPRECRRQPAARAQGGQLVGQAEPPGGGARGLCTRLSLSGRTPGLKCTIKG